MLDAKPALARCSDETGSRRLEAAGHELMAKAVDIETALQLDSTNIANVD